MIMVYCLKNNEKRAQFRILVGWLWCVDHVCVFVNFEELGRCLENLNIFSLILDS